MTFVLDENFPATALELLAREGHEGHRSLEWCPKGTDDTEIFRTAQAHEAIFVTTDKDFFHTVPLLFENHVGVFVIALSQPNRRALLRRLEWALRWLQQGDIRGKVLLVTDYSHLISTGH